MSVLRRYLIAAAAFCLLACLTACNPATDREGDQTGPASKAIKAVPVETIGELIAITVAGDAGQPVKRWIEREAPYVEAYSFIEYPTEFAAGHAYYWGDWLTRADQFCAVRMQRDYTPVQIDFSLGWYAQLSGRSIEQLIEEYQAVQAEHAGATEENIGQDGKVIGDVYLIDTEDFHARLFMRDDMGPELAVFSMMLPVQRVEYVTERNRRYAELLEFATDDQPATLSQLIALVSEQGARGILDHFDFSEFARQLWYTPLDGSDIRDYSQATKYTYGILTWNGAWPCYLAAYDDGARMQLTFSSGWYERHAGHSIAELSAEFDELFAADGRGRISLDSRNDAYDVDFAWAYHNGVNLVRRTYLHPPRPGHAHYSLINGPELFPAAPGTFPVYSAADLPEPSGETDALELLLRELASTPAPDIIATRVVGALYDQAPLGLNLVQPFTMRSYYTVLDPITQRRLCAVQLLDDMYLESFGFNPGWFTEQTGLSQKELERSFTSLAERYGTVAGAGGVQPDGTLVFDYGPLNIAFTRGNREDRSDDWYSVVPPLWP